jgi:hypothetical protein
MNTLKLTRLRVGGKLRWGWIFLRDGKPQYGSAGFFTSKAKAEEHFFKLHHPGWRATITDITIEEEQQ